MMTPYEIREIERKIKEANEEIKVLQRLLDKALIHRGDLELKLVITRKRIDESGIKY